VDGAQRLWGELLQLGKEMGEGSVHARALAGLGLISLVKGRYEEGRDGLENAIFRMRDQSNQNLLPDAMLWLAEMLHAEGHLERAREQALEADGVARSIPRLRLCTAALGMAAQTLFDLGAPHDARILAQDSSTMALAQGPVETTGEVSSVLSAVRVLVGLNAMEEAQKLLPNVPPSNTRDMVGVADPMGGLLAIKSRVVLERNPTVAVALARQVADRPAAILPWAAVRHLLDAAHTLVGAGDERAAETVQRVLDQLKDTRFRLLKMEAGLLAEKAGIAPEAALEARKVLDILDHELGSPEAFKSRWLGTEAG
jgi:tetratricopeptide (TPR) repeat protein